jgi:hypothetical protein
MNTLENMDTPDRVRTPRKAPESKLKNEVGKPATDLAQRKQGFLDEINAVLKVPQWVGEGTIVSVGFVVWQGGKPNYIRHEVPRDEFNALAYAKILQSYRAQDTRIATDTAFVQSIVPKKLAENLFGGVEAPCSMLVMNSDGSVRIGEFKMGERVEIGVVRTENGFYTVMRKKGAK